MCEVLCSWSRLFPRAVLSEQGAVWEQQGPGHTHDCSAVSVVNAGPSGLEAPTPKCG